MEKRNFNVLFIITILIFTIIVNCPTHLPDEDEDDNDGISGSLRIEGTIGGTAYVQNETFVVYYDSSSDQTVIGVSDNDGDMNTNCWTITFIGNSKGVYNSSNYNRVHYLFSISDSYITKPEKNLTINILKYELKTGGALEGTFNGVMDSSNDVDINCNGVFKVVLNNIY